MKFGLEGRSVLVMAASKGIGLASARAFHAAGSNISICARGAEALHAAAASMPGALALQADATDPADIARVVAEATARFGPPEVLVNNSGGPPAGLFEALDDAAWAAAVNNTLMSAIRLTRAVLPAMRAARWGRIVNISSSGVRQPVPGLTLSNSVRMAVLGWAKTLSAQVAADGILVNTVCPGWTETDRVTQLLGDRAASSGRTEAEIAAEIAAEIPLGRMGRAEEVANLVLFLGSEASSYITGTAIPVDGGAVKGYA
ncbi:MAG: SDR family oxidoreductase [Sandaracinobacteroides sp.]